jgi:hypothetical protein
MNAPDRARGHLRCWACWGSLQTDAERSRFAGRPRCLSIHVTLWRRRDACSVLLTGIDQLHCMVGGAAPLRLHKLMAKCILLIKAKLFPLADFLLCRMLLRTLQY